MNLYLIERDHENDPRPTWDTFLGHVVRAANEQNAREIAREEAADEGADVWNDPAVKIELLAEGVRGEPGIVLSDFNAG